jgi:choline-glycine betaine transporter
MIAASSRLSGLSAAAVPVLGTAAARDWFGVLRAVLMVLGGFVVVAITLVVGVAIVSGVLGMVGRLRRPRR